MMTFVLKTVNEETKELRVEERSWVEEDHQRQYFKCVRFEVCSERSDKRPHIFVDTDDDTSDLIDDVFFYDMSDMTQADAIELIINHVVEPIAKRLKKGFLYTMLEDADSEYGIIIYVAPQAYAIEYIHEPGEIYPNANQKFTEIHKLSKHYQFLFKCIHDTYEKKI